MARIFRAWLTRVSEFKCSQNFLGTRKYFPTPETLSLITDVLIRLLCVFYLYLYVVEWFQDNFLLIWTLLIFANWENVCLNRNFPTLTPSPYIFNLVALLGSIYYHYYISTSYYWLVKNYSENVNKRFCFDFEVTGKLDGDFKWQAVGNALKAFAKLRCSFMKSEVLIALQNVHLEMLRCLGKSWLN